MKSIPPPLNPDMSSVIWDVIITVAGLVLTSTVDGEKEKLDKTGGVTS